MHLVDLVGVYGVDAVPPELKGFVHFQANMESLELTGSERVALLVVQNTESHIVVFIDKVGDIGEIEARLEKQQSRLSEGARAALLQTMGQ